MNVFRAVALLLPLCAACRAPAATETVASAPLPVATMASVATAKEPNSPGPLPSGASEQAAKWSGSYSVAVHRIERPSQQVAWLRDDGRAHSGAGVLTIERNARGEVAGTARGPLGEQRVAGAFDGSRLTLSLVPAHSASSEVPAPAAASGTVSGDVVPGGAAAVRLAEDTAFRGTAQCEATPGDTLTCTLSAVSSNGNLVRAGSANLRPLTSGAVP